MAVTLTDTAAREIASIIEKEPIDREKVRLRVGVKGGGCSGFSYILDLTETQKDHDEEWAYTFPVAENGEAEGEGGGGGVATEEFTIRVICDPKSYLYLNGTSIDFKSGVMGRGFVFNNPNATNSCGCGSSFAV